MDGSKAVLKLLISKSWKKSKGEETTNTFYSERSAGRTVPSRSLRET